MLEKIKIRFQDWKEFKKKQKLAFWKIKRTARPLKRILQELEE